MYPEYMMESIRKVEQTRPRRLETSRKHGKQVFTAMTKEEREHVLRTFHPDFQDDARRPVRIGPNKGEAITTEIADLLESYSRVDPAKFDLTQPDYDVDVLIVGAGSAGMAAALEASNKGASVLLVTKLRLGDSNSMMAQGGIQAATQADDNPIWHYLDVMGGGHFDNKPELVRALVNDAPFAINWLQEMGVMFDKKPDGQFALESGGGTCRLRMHSCRDYTGAGICRVLRDEVYNRRDRIKFVEYTAVVELLRDARGEVAGAVAMHLENKQYSTIRARSVIVSTGGFGRLHIRGYETTNHYGATADGLVLGYRVGARLLYMDSVQYHPTGAVFPEQIVGFLCTEKIRALGAQPVNRDGELFVFPLEPRDVESSAFIRECVERNLGVVTPSGLQGVWLDTPLIDQLHGKGHLQRSLPAMFRQYKRFDIDITKYPMLVYPTLHYQNGGLEIDERARTSVPGLFVAGEASGGVHGRNRLMGNSQLDVVVFGRRAGTNAAEFALGRDVPQGLNLGHVYDYNRDVEALGVDPKKVAPRVLPDYIPDHVKAKQLTAVYHGTLI
jgi:succinate dehydrogenase/fumarate reductase flavoprotein subunit